MNLTPPRAAAAGAAIGATIALFTVAVEAWVRGVGVVGLHTESVAVWVVDSLPLMLGLAGYGVADKRRASAPRPVSRHRVAPQASTPRASPTPTPAPPPFRTASPTPARRAPVGRTASPAPAPERVTLSAALREQVLLLVDRSPEGPVVVSTLEEAGLRVVHVRDAMSGAVAFEAEGATVAAIDSADGAAEVLRDELRSDGVPLVALGADGVPRPLTAAALTEALERALRD